MNVGRPERDDGPTGTRAAVEPARPRRRAASRRGRGSPRPRAPCSAAASVSAPSGPTIVTAFVSTSKPASARDTSLATMRSSVLPLALRGRARDHVLGLGGEADEQRPCAGRPARRSAELAEDVRRLLQHERQRLVALRHFLPGAVGRRVVGDGRRHDDDVGASGARHHRPVHLGRAAHANDLADRRRLDRRRPGDQRHLARRGARPRRQSQTPSARSIGCRCSAPDRRPRRSARR